MLGFGCILATECKRKDITVEPVFQIVDDLCELRHGCGLAEDVAMLDAPTGELAIGKDVAMA